MFGTFSNLILKDHLKIRTRAFPTELHPSHSQGIMYNRKRHDSTAQLRITVNCDLSRFHDKCNKQSNSVQTCKRV